MVNVITVIQAGSNEKRKSLAGQASSLLVSKRLSKIYFNWDLDNFL